MASLQANMARKIRENDTDISKEEIEDYVSEGFDAVVPYCGSAQKLLTQLIGGLQSGMSYSNAQSIDELHEKAVIVRMISGG